MSKEQFVSEHLPSKEIQDVVDRFNRKVTDYKLVGNVDDISLQFVEMVYDLLHNNVDRVVLYGDIQKFTREFVIMTKSYALFSMRLLGNKKIFHHHYIDMVSEFGTDSVFFIGDYDHTHSYKKNFFSRLFKKEKSLSSIIQKNIEYDFSFAIDKIIEKKLAEHNLLHKKELVINNFKFYFGAAQYFSKKKSMGMLSPPIDFIWHTIASDTIAYHDFCDINEVFVYHNPGEPTKEGFEEDYSNYLYFLNVLLQNSDLIPDFKDINIFSIWPVPNSLVIEAYDREIIGTNSGFLMFDTHPSKCFLNSEKINLLKYIVTKKIT